MGFPGRSQKQDWQGLPNAYVKLLNTTEYCYNTEYYYVFTLSSNSSKFKKSFIM